MFAKTLRGPALALGFFLATIALATPAPVYSDDESGCNNKYCPKDSDECEKQINGPDTHCLDDDVMCLWAACDPN